MVQIVALVERPVDSVSRLLTTLYPYTLASKNISSTKVTAALRISSVRIRISSSLSYRPTIWNIFETTTTVVIYLTFSLSPARPAGCIVAIEMWSEGNTVVTSKLNLSQAGKTERSTTPVCTENRMASLTYRMALHPFRQIPLGTEDLWPRMPTDKGFPYTFVATLMTKLGDLRLVYRPITPNELQRFIVE